MSFFLLADIWFALYNCYRSTIVSHTLQALSKNHKEQQYLAKACPKKRRIHVPHTCLPVRVHNERQRRIHPPLPRPFRISRLPQDLRRVGRRGALRGRTGRYVYCSKLSLLARVAAASHRVIFIIRPFVFSAAARLESNNSARPPPRERFFSFSKSLSLSRSLSFIASFPPPLLFPSSRLPPLFASTFSDLRLSLTAYPLSCLSCGTHEFPCRYLVSSWCNTFLLLLFLPFRSLSFFPRAFPSTALHFSYLYLNSFPLSLALSYHCNCPRSPRVTAITPLLGIWPHIDATSSFETVFPLSKFANLVSPIHRNIGVAML